MRRGLRWVVVPAVALGLVSCAATGDSGYGYYANYPDYAYPGDFYGPFYGPAFSGFFFGRGLRHDRHHDFMRHEGHHDRDHTVGGAAHHEGEPHQGVFERAQHEVAAHGGNDGGHHH